MTFLSSKEAPARQSHDSLNPPNLVAFMLKSWKPKKAGLPPKIRNVANFARRRAALSARFPGEAIIVPTGHLKVRANDDHYRFRAGTDFYYLTGNQEPDCTLVLVPTGDAKKGGHEAVMFVEPNPGKTDESFFTDRIKGELWEGARLGVPESQAKYGLPCRPIAELHAAVRAQAAGKFRILRGFSAKTEGWCGPAAELADQKTRDQELATFLSEMRLIKDKEELLEMAAVVKATQLGFEDVIRRMKTAKTERELEGVFFTRARMEGNDIGYGSIVASGEHACTLHWNKNTGDLAKRDLLLLDAGIEGHSLYTADITRTFPIGGKFSREQKLVYELVLKAQKAAFKAVKPGNDFMAPNRAAMVVLAHGLVELGILKCSAEEALRDENQFYKRYSLHNVSHMLGIDVHDCAQARAEAYKYGALRPGMVLTVEPGLYFQPDDLTVPPQFRGIGVRIEDDVVVTDKGCRNLSASIPSEVKALEAWIKRLWGSKPTSRR